MRPCLRGAVLRNVDRCPQSAMVGPAGAGAGLRPPCPLRVTAMPATTTAVAHGSDRGEPVAALCSPSFSPTLQIPDKQFRFRTSISDSGQALQIPDQRFRFRTSDGQRQTFGVLEIRNSRSRRNACSLCCKSFHSDGQRQTTFPRQATGRRAAGRSGPPRSLLRPGRGALCRGGSLSESVACHSAAHPGAPAIGEERLGGPGRGGSGGPARCFKLIRKFITKQTASNSAASRVPYL